MRLFSLLFCACAARTPAPSTPLPPSRPHVVARTADRLSCPKTQTAVTLAGWTGADATDETLVLLRADACKAVIVARASRTLDRGNDFARSWAFAERALKDVTWFAESPIDPRTIADEKFSDDTAGVRVIYERDELASLTCSFLVIGESACLGEVLANMTRAPAALRAPPSRSSEPAPKVLPDNFIAPPRSDGNGRPPN